MAERSPAAVAWADRLQAEIRDNARQLYSEALAAAGITVAYTPETLEKIDFLFQIGADAAIVALANHGCLQKAVH